MMVHLPVMKWEEGWLQKIGKMGKWYPYLGAPLQCSISLSGAALQYSVAPSVCFLLATK